jgi:signal transduction histidine kinase
MTPEADPALMLAAFEAGAEDCLARDAAPELGRERLRALLRRKRVDDEAREDEAARLRAELAASEARAALALAETRAGLLAELEQKHAALERALAQAEEATAAKNEFLANMSHEIRTPLTAIAGMADLLAATPLSDEQSRYVGIFRRASENLLALVNDVLDLAKIEAGHLALEALRFSLRERVAQAAETAALRAHAKGLAVSWQVAPELPDAFVGDPHRLSQVLGNLLGNAVKFTETGSVALHVARPAAGEPGTLHFSVADTGPGVPEAQRQAIFAKFVQAETSTTRRFGGTGLGLSISQQLVARLGGRIWIESEEGRGSTFHFTVDLAVGSGPLPAAPEPLEAAPGAAQPLRILLAEDSEDNRVIFEAYFRGQPYALEVVTDGQAAVARATAERYDLVLMDMQMPVMDGFAATRAIRAQEAASGRPHTPIVALTAFALKEEVRKTREAGCDAHLVKPISRKALLEAVKTFTAERVGDHGP